jgi:hypothetical protein
VFCRLQPVVNEDAVEKLPCSSAAFVANRSANLRVFLFSLRKRKRKTANRLLPLRTRRLEGVEQVKSSIRGYEAFASTFGKAAADASRER